MSAGLQWDSIVQDKGESNCTDPFGDLLYIPLGDSRSRTSMEFGQLTSEKQVLRELRSQIHKLGVCLIGIFLAQARQQDLRRRPEVAAMRGSDLDLLDAAALIAADSCEQE